MTPVELPGGLVVAFRPGEPGDRAFICSSWLRGHHREGDWPRRLGIHRCAQAGYGTVEDGRGCSCCKFSHRRYFDEHGLVVERLLERAQVLVACNPERTTQIIGYIVFGPGVLHWVFVKEPFRYDRNQDINPRLGSALLERALRWPTPAPVSCSHWTRAIVRAANKWSLRYDPFALEAM